MIVSDPDVMNGEPCYEGTRIPVQVVIDSVLDGYTATGLARAYPTLPTDAVEEALRWAHSTALGPSHTTTLELGLDLAFDPVTSLILAAAEALDSDLLDAAAMLDGADVRDAADAGYLVPPGQSLHVALDDRAWVVTVQEVTS